MTAVFGTAFSKITYSPTPNLANTRIAFERTGALNELYVAPSSDVSRAHVVPGMTSVYYAPSWSRDGRIVVVRNPTGSQSEIWVTNADGSNAHKIGYGGYPNWSPDNYHIAFYAYDGLHDQIETMTASGGSVVTISDGTSDDTNPIWSADGSQIFFIRFNSSSGHQELWKMNANGTSPQKVVATGGDIDFGAVNPQSNEIIYDVNANTFTELFATSYPLGQVAAFANDNGAIYQYPVWAPDGSKVLFSENTGNASFLKMASPGGNNKTVYASENDTSLGLAAWEPFPVAQPFVSSTGGYLVSNTSSGFLYGLNGDGFSSFLSFTCTTPSTATVTADPVTPGQSNLLYRLNGDAITSIKFLNGFGAAVSSVSTGNAKQAVVAFNGGTGGIVSILIGLKMSPVISKNRIGSVVNGVFTAVYDAHGKNLAPKGASTVTLGKDGEIVSVR